MDFQLYTCWSTVLEIHCGADYKSDFDLDVFHGWLSPFVLLPALFFALNNYSLPDNISMGAIVFCLCSFCKAKQLLFSMRAPSRSEQSMLPSEQIMQL